MFPVQHRLRVHTPIFGLADRIESFTKDPYLGPVALPSTSRQGTAYLSRSIVLKFILEDFHRASRRSWHPYSMFHFCQIMDESSESSRCCPMAYQSKCKVNEGSKLFCFEVRTESHFGGLYLLVIPFFSFNILLKKYI